MRKFAKSLLLLVSLSIVVSSGNLRAQTPTWPQLFQPSCNGTGGCQECSLHGQECCLNGDVGCACAAQSTGSSWFTTGTADNVSITIEAAAAGENYCQTVTTEGTCQFNLGDNGVTQISFDFTVTGECEGTSPIGTEWLAFWLLTDPWNGKQEVDFIESRFGPSSGLNTNFDGNGNQVVIYPSPTSLPASDWTGSITATFSGSGSSVGVQVHNSVNNNVGTTNLISSTGYFFAMDTAGGSKNPSCKITVSNLEMEGTVPNPSTNCVGLPISGN